MGDRAFDVAVIGAGVVGTAIARELSRYETRVGLIEAAHDVGVGTTKANTSLLHTGFDARPGTLEADLVSQGHGLLTTQAPELGIPVERVGALMLAWSDEELRALDGVERNARRNGYQRTRPVAVAEIYQREPHLAPGVRGGLEIPDEGIMCTFTTPLAFAIHAVVNGTTLLLDTPVTSIRSNGGLHVLNSPQGPIMARWVVNAAGLHSDAVDQMFGHDDFRITPRRGQLVVFDKLARRLVGRILLPVPSAQTKGVLVAPTVFGNVLLGPTAEDLHDRTATQTTADGVASLLADGARLVPDLLAEEVTATYAGLRAATDDADYQIAPFSSQRYVRVAGIRSTGLSASLGIAVHVRHLLEEAGLALVPKRHHVPVRMPNIGEAGPRPYRDAAVIAGDPDYGRIVCFCERATLGEIRDAFRGPVPARSVDGLRRRTRALLGRCQGFYCGARIEALREQFCGEGQG